MVVYTAVEFIKIMIIAILAAQFSYGCAILLLERTMLGFYQLSIFDHPTNIIQKATNVFQRVTIGSGYYIYTKIGKYNWFVRKILFIFILAMQGCLSVILFQVIKLILEILVPIPL